jgi:hypothetical protein
MPTGHRHRVAPIAAAIVAVAMFIAPTGSAEPIPSVRLFAASTHLRVQSGGNDVVSVDPGIYITPTGDDFELHVSRSNYDTPFTFEQVDSDTGAILWRGWSDDRCRQHRDYHHHRRNNRCARDHLLRPERIPR